MVKSNHNHGGVFRYGKKVNVKRHASKANDAAAMYREAGFGGILWKRRIALVKGKSVRGMEIVRLAKPFMLFLSGSFHASVKLKQRDKFRFVEMKIRI